MGSRSICIFALAVGGGAASGAFGQHRGAVHTGTADGPQFTTETLEKRLTENPNLAARVEALLPPGVSLQAAAAGFRDEGQFIAALHVSHNLNIPFNELKADLTSAKQGSLGRALRDLRPELRAKVIDSQIKKAERQARGDIEQAGELAESSEK